MKKTGMISSSFVNVVLDSIYECVFVNMFD